MFLVILLYALWGFTFTLGKIILSYAQPFFSVGTRMFVSGLSMTAYILIRHRMRCYPARTDFYYYLQLITFGVCLPYTARSWALQFMSTMKSALIFNLTPFFAAFFAYLFLNEKLSFHKILGLIIGFAGMFPVLWLHSSTEGGFNFFGFLSVPEIAMLIAVASLSYSLIIMQQLVKHRGCPPVLVNATSMVIGGALILSFSSIVEVDKIKSNPWTFATLLLVQLVISNLICANLQATLLKKYSSTLMAFATFLSPLFAAFYGWILLGENVTWHFFASFLLVMVGLAIYYYDDFYKHRHKKDFKGLVEQ